MFLICPRGRYVGRIAFRSVGLLYPSSLPDCRPPQKETSRYVFDEDGATLAEIEAQGWSLNPGRYVGVAERQEAEDFDFAEH